jgi:hypothetical protein
MPRRHGKDGRVYVALTSGGTAEPIAFLSSWSINFTTDRVDVTAFGDANKVYVAGLPDSQGDFSGFWDSDQSDLYAAAQDGIARKFYLYPSRALDSSDYYFGEALFDFSVSGGVSDAVTVSGSWAASSAISRNSA